jgi:hypothetical protein
VLGSTYILTAEAGTLWDSFTWGAANWSSNANVPVVYTIPWPQALVFQKMVLDISASSSESLSIGSFFARYQDTGYVNQG